MKNKSIIPVNPMLAGLLTGQILGFLHVYLSNMDLFRKLTLIQEAGYFTVPNVTAIQTLKGLGVAFCGGLFFTLTVGASLTIITLAAIWIWINLFRKNRFALIPLFLPWVVFLAGANLRIFSSMATAYFIIIPVVVIITARRWLTSEPTKKSWLKAATLLSPVILLSILWSTLLFQDPLVTLGNIRNIRDYYLLSNPVGIGVYNFYYKYTLYASEAIKPLRYKVFKTCSLLNLEQDPDLRSMEKRLTNRDYLVLDTANVELKIDRQGDELVFLNNGKEVLRTSQEDFLSDPNASLNAFSGQTDRYDFFRAFTYLSILAGFPLMLYLLLFTLLEKTFCFIKSTTISLAIASAICLCIGIALFIPMYGIKTVDLNASEIAGKMQTDQWQDQVTALREISVKGLEITDYQDYIDMKDSPYVPVRYWLIKALGISKKQEIRDELFDFMDDPYPNIVCQALEAIGQRGDKRDAEIIVQRTKESPSLYVQFNAYRAMKDLGWRQTRSTYGN